MKKIKLFNLVFALFITINLMLLSGSALSASKSKQKGLSEEDMTKLQESVAVLVKKIYASSLFSPEDADNLVDIKTKLDSSMGTVAKDPVFAQLYYDVGYILEQREYTDDAAQYFMFVKDKFSNGIYAKKAVNELKKMGITQEVEETPGTVGE